VSVNACESESSERCSAQIRIQLVEQLRWVVQAFLFTRLAQYNTIHTMKSTLKNSQEHEACIKQTDRIGYEEALMLHSQCCLEEARSGGSAPKDAGDTYAGTPQIPDDQ